MINRLLVSLISSASPCFLLIAQTPNLTRERSTTICLLDTALFRFACSILRSPMALLRKSPKRSGLYYLSGAKGTIYCTYSCQRQFLYF